MDWFFSLVHSLCPFCDSVLARPNQACSACADEMAAIEITGCVRAGLSGGVERDSAPQLPIVAATTYEGWAREVVLRQKRGSKSSTVIAWLADMLTHAVPPEWRELELLWLPGAPWSEIHLVEWLALELSKRGLKLYPRAALQRNLWPTKPQKALKMEERRTRDMRQSFRASGASRAGKRVILLDDVITTGGTITGCRTIVEQDLGLEVAGALALAYTPRRNHK
jgi:predicted amidophosphoribosyltransferase